MKTVTEFLSDLEGIILLAFLAAIGIGGYLAYKKICSKWPSVCSDSGYSAPDGTTYPYAGGNVNPLNWIAQGNNMGTSPGGELNPLNWNWLDKAILDTNDDTNSPSDTGGFHDDGSSSGTASSGGGTGGGGGSAF